MSRPQVQVVPAIYLNPVVHAVDQERNSFAEDLPEVNRLLNDGFLDDLPSSGAMILPPADNTSNLKYKLRSSLKEDLKYLVARLIFFHFFLSPSPIESNVLLDIIIKHALRIKYISFKKNDCF